MNIPCGVMIVKPGETPRPKVFLRKPLLPNLAPKLLGLCPTGRLSLDPQACLGWLGSDRGFQGPQGL